jgi:AraC-like DNA-binding protein
MTPFETWLAGGQRSPAPEFQLFFPPDQGNAPRVLYAGWQRCAPGHAHAGCRPHALLHWVLEGRGAVRSGGAWIDVGAGGGFLFRADERFSYRADGTDPWAYVWLALGGQEAEAWIDSAGLREGRSVVPAGPASPGAAAFFGRFFSEASAAEGRPARLARLGRRGALEALDFLEEAAAAAGWPSSAPPAAGHADRIRQFLEENYSRRLSTEIVARAVHLDRAHCCTLFRRRFGSGIMAWLAEYRLRRAADLLADRRLRLTDVAASVGIQNEAHFSRAFRAAYGQSPGAWRRANCP